MVLVFVLFVCGESKELEDTGTKPKGLVLLKIDCTATWMLQKRWAGLLGALPQSASSLGGFPGNLETIVATPLLCTYPMYGRAAKAQN